MEAEADALRREIALLEGFLQRLDHADPQLPSPGSASCPTVDIVQELKPYFRRLFSGDQLTTTEGNLDGQSVGVTLEVIGDGDRITSVFVLGEAAPASGDATEPTHCSVCDKAFGDDVKAWSAGGELFCQDCFCCASCGSSLESVDLFSVAGKVYCSKHNPSVGMCGKCGEALVSGKVISAMGKKFHAACFVCAECGCPFSNNDTIFVADGQPFCETHAPSTEEGEDEESLEESEY